MSKEICKCGIEKRYHFEDFHLEKIIEMKKLDLIDNNMVEKMMDYFIDSCNNYQQDNLNFLEAEVERRETC